ncbi:MAG: hypothetical protein JWQ78_1440, partial [Sediminibacterium sp.]|nr:hypothetical protein [Sediminibacterium sp.]
EPAGCTRKYAGIPVNAQGRIERIGAVAAITRMIIVPASEFEVKAFIGAIVNE